MHPLLPPASRTRPARVVFALALAFAACVAATPLAAQPLSVHLSDVDFTGLPTVKLKICAERGGALLRGLDADNLTLTDNGIRRPLTVRCPDPTRINSVVMVLDNSGSMLGVMPKLIEAAGRLVDSLGATDECAIVTFGRFITVRQDFTTNKTQLKAVLAALVAEGGTPLYDASLLGLDILSARPGNRHAVIITDGEDNMSVNTAAAVVARAQANTIKIHSIAFGITEPYLSVMRGFATGTGGLFFSVVRPSELTNVYERIAAEITERCCVVEYQANCTDSLRTLDVTVRVGADSARTVESFVTPSRPPAAVLAVTVPSSLAPFESGLATITLSPAPVQTLALNLRFTVEFDEKLVKIDPLLPFTLGTVAENQIVTMTQIAPGRVAFGMSNIIPAAATQLLVGFPIQGLPADTSRAVEFRIVDAELDGCPVVLTTSPDTVDVCQCLRPFAVGFPAAPSHSSDGNIEVPLLVPPGMLDPRTRALLRVDIALPADAALLDVLPGDVFPEGTVLSSRPDTRTLRLFTDGTVLPARADGVLASLRLAVTQQTSATALHIDLLRARLWQQCCPSDTTIAAGGIFIDGYCEKLLQRRGDAPSMRIAPHPVTRDNGGTLHVYVPERFAGAACELSVTDMNGKLVRSLPSRVFPQGETLLALDTDGLPAGRYMVLLRARDTAAGLSFLVAR